MKRFSWNWTDFSHRGRIDDLGKTREKLKGTACLAVQCTVCVDRESLSGSSFDQCFRLLRCQIRRISLKNSSYEYIRL